MLTVRELDIPGVLEITPRRFGDQRGYFSETYNAEAFAKAGVSHVFVQDNQSYSAARGVLRGLHYQLPPRAQDKLVRVLSGAVLDVAVDIRKSSPTFGKWVSCELTAEKGNQLFVPKGFAHGFLTLTENVVFFYKVTDIYSPEHDRGIRFSDPTIGIDWPFAEADIRLADKDRVAPFLADAEVFE